MLVHFPFWFFLDSPIRYIAHLDLDCFFVSVERIKNPSLNGKPVAVGGSPQGRGVIASASYEAREFGVHSAMPTSRALTLCPHLIVVRGRHGEYSKISDKLYRRMLELAPVVERASIDEMYMDFTGCESLYDNDLPGFMKTIQKLVQDEFQLPCTIALASNTTVAKIAAGTVKPKGVCWVPHGTEAQFLAPLPIGVIPGIGKKTEEHLRAQGFRYVSDIQAISQEQLTRILGKHGVWIHNAALGQGSDVIGGEYAAKSISREETFSHDIGDRTELERILHELVEDVCSSLRSSGWKAGTITLKLRYGDFKTTTHARSLEPTNDDAVVYRAVRELFAEARTRHLPVRLLGVRLSGFREENQLDLGLLPIEKRKQEILNAVDALRKKFGGDVIHIGKV